MRRYMYTVCTKYNETFRTMDTLLIERLSFIQKFQAPWEFVILIASDGVVMAVFLYVKVIIIILVSL